MFLGIDHGTRRIGLALSDPLGILASPLEILEDYLPEQIQARLDTLIRKHAIQALVVGIPLRADGSEGRDATRIRSFEAQLRLWFPAMPIHLVDETLSTVTAESQLATTSKHGSGKDARVDAHAACVILQDFLDQNQPPLELPEVWENMNPRGNSIRKKRKERN